MKLEYTERTSNFKEGVAYRHPSFFQSVEKGFDPVVVEGDFPDIVAAYEAAEIKVVEVSLADVKASGKEINLDEIRRFLETVDHADDSLWTQAGLIKTAIVESALDNVSINRADIDAASPGFERIIKE